MRIAVIADIHGNLGALEAVLADVAAQGADQLVVNGDMVNRGPQNAEVIERLDGTDAIKILGNHDDLLRMWIDRDDTLPHHWFGNPFWEGTAWCARQLDRAGLIEPLRHLPMSYRIELPGAPRILIAHGSPRHYREGYGRSRPGSFFEEIGEEYRAEVLVGSHTHIPLHREHGGRLALNTGAVGTPFNGDGRAHYLLLTLEGTEWQPELRRVEYDRKASLRAFEESGYLEEGGLSARIFHEELKLARSLFTPFLTWVEAGNAALDDEGWEEFRRGHPERFAPLSEFARRN